VVEEDGVGAARNNEYGNRPQQKHWHVALLWKRDFASLWQSNVFAKLSFRSPTWEAWRKYRVALQNEGAWALASGWLQAAARENVVTSPDVGYENHTIALRRFF
jgi:hypothetical protein